MPCSQAIFSLQILVIVELGRAREKVSEKAMGEKRACRINVTRQCHTCHIRNTEPELQALQSRHHGLLRLGLLRLGLGRLTAFEWQMLNEVRSRAYDWGMDVAER